SVTSCELRAPQQVAFGPTVASSLVAEAVSIPAEAIVTATHEPQVVSAGLPFVIVEVRDEEALAQMRTNTKGFEAIRDVLKGGLRASLYFYARATPDADVRARMFAPLSGVPEDPATGSAGCAVAGLLAHHHAAADGESSYRIVQGVEMGRPSVL